MNTNHLAYFVEVAKRRSISKAAKELFISQPSLSAAIAKLEEELGVKLFYRSQNGTHLTEQGQQILEYAEEVLKNIDNIKSVIAQDVELVGKIKISAVPAACDYFIIKLIELAHNRYPQMKIMVHEERPHAVVQQVIQGEANLGISSYRMNQEKSYQLLFKEKRLEFIPLFTDKLCVYVSTSHPLAQKSSVTMAELNQYPQACFQKDIDMHDLTKDMEILSLQSQMNIESERNIYQFSNAKSIIEIVAKDLAVAILPERLKKSAEASDKLIQLPVVDSDLRVVIGIIRRNVGVASIIERKTMEMLREISE